MTRAIRLALLLCFTVAAIVLTTLPGTTRLIHGLAELWNYSESTAALLHCLLFALLTFVWFRLAVGWLPRPRAILVAAGVALAVGTATETLQLFIPSRGATLLDLGANWLGILAVAGWLYTRKRTQPYTT